MAHRRRGPPTRTTYRRLQSFPIGRGEPSGSRRVARFGRRLEFEATEGGQLFDGEDVAAHGKRLPPGVFAVENDEDGVGTEHRLSPPMHVDLRESDSLIAADLDRLDHHVPALPVRFGLEATHRVAERTARRRPSGPPGRRTCKPSRLGARRQRPRLGPSRRVAPDPARSSRAPASAVRPRPSGPRLHAASRPRGRPYVPRSRGKRRSRESRSIAPRSAGAGGHSVPESRTRPAAWSAMTSSGT